MAKRSAKNTLLKVSIASVYTTVAHLISLNGPESEVQESGIPCLDDSGATIDHDLTGYTEPGGADFEVYWDPLLAVHQAMTAKIRTPVKSDWQHCYPVGTPMTYTGILKKFSPASAVGEFLKASGSIQATTLPVYPS